MIPEAVATSEIHTPTLDRVAKLGIFYNRFHSTAMCSPTRASLLTGRNHTRTGNGQIAANLHQSGILATLRDTLLPRLLSGELSVAEKRSEVFQ